MGPFFIKSLYFRARENKKRGKTTGKKSFICAMLIVLRIFCGGVESRVTEFEQTY